MQQQFGSPRRSPVAHPGRRPPQAPAGDDVDVAFWIRHVRIGVILSVLAALLGYAYAGLSWGAPHRLAFVAVLSVVLCASPMILVLPLARIVLHRRGLLFFYGWSGVITATITILASLDGGAESPYVILYTLALAFAGTAYPPSGVVGIGAVAVAGFLTLQVRTGLEAATAVTITGGLALVTAMAALVAGNHRRADTDRRTAEGRFRAALESANDAYVAIDDAGLVTDWNRQSATTFGFGIADAVGRPLVELLVPPALRDGHVLGELASAPPGQSLEARPPVEGQALHRDGHAVPIEITVWSTTDAGRHRHHAFLRDISERQNAERAQERHLADLRASRAALALAQEETIRRLASAADHRDNETGQHLDRMSRYCALLAEKAGLPQSRSELLRMASPMHDVGKIGIPDHILLKPGPFTPSERAVMETHPSIGHAILSGSRSELLQLGATLALTHHERYDGQGYPHGLMGEEIPLEGRIAAIADVFDALTSDRVYRPAFGLPKAVDVMRRGAGTQFDPGLLEVFLAHLADIANIRAGSPDARTASYDAHGALHERAA